MKKTLIIIIFTILTITGVKSQEKIELGVKAGINLTNMTSGFLIDENYKTNFHIGLLAEIPFGGKFSLQPEIVYSTYGTKAKTTALDAGISSAVSDEYSLEYIQVPLLAKIYLFENFSIEIGPSFNFLVNSEEKLGSYSYSDKAKSFEFGGALGISYKLKSSFFGSVRYTNGFTKVLKEDIFDENAKNYGFLIGIGYLF